MSRPNEERTEPARSLFMDGYRAFLDSLKAADAGPDQDAGADAFIFILSFPARIGDRLIGGAHRINDEIVDLALLLRLHAVVRVELARPRPSGNEAADLTRDIRNLELGDAPCAALPRDEVRPHVINADANRRDQSDTSYDYPTHQALRLILHG